MSGRSGTALLVTAVAAAASGGLGACSSGADPGVEEVAWASAAVPSAPAAPSAPGAAASSASPAVAPPDAADQEEVLAAHRRYVAEADRFVDLAVAEAVATGAYAGSPGLDRVLDAVAVDPVRSFDVRAAQSLWAAGAVRTAGEPSVLSARVTALDIRAGTATVESCTDVGAVDAVGADGTSVRPEGIAPRLAELVTLSRTGNPRNDGVTGWYVADRAGHEVAGC